jgi:hypothetical protein
MLWLVVCARLLCDIIRALAASKARMWVVVCVRLLTVCCHSTLNTNTGRTRSAFCYGGTQAGLVSIDGADAAPLGVLDAFATLLFLLLLFGEHTAGEVVNVY